MWSYVFTFLAGLIVGMGIILVWKGMQLLAEIRLASKATEDALKTLHGTVKDARPSARCRSETAGVGGSVESRVVRAAGA